MPKISVTDKPLASQKGPNNEIVRRSKLGADNPDKLNTGKYAETLAEFVRACDTPMTIGVQGEWGSGKTSLLNMIREELEEECRTWNRKTIQGRDEYKTIWINTWEHSLLKTPEECLLSIIEEIIDEIAIIDNSYNKAAQAKSALATLAKGAVRVGAQMTLGMKGGQVADELLGTSTSNTVKELRNSLDDIVSTVVQREQNDAQKFVVFVDDLDRLEPSVAVLVLELLKNIFTIDHCVFILAIDYQVVVKGLKGKFGEPNSDNEWEFRAFFDKIIQLPFMMPMAAYDLKAYINALLIDDINFFAKSERSVIEDGSLARAVKLTLGHNPRAMKRLLNSLSLLKLQHGHGLKDFRLRKLIFALVCCQISFPRIYELLLREPDFSSWDNEFVNRVTGGPHEENLEIQRALDKAIQVHQEDFDEDWEQALFQIVWLKNWQRNRLPETSRLLTEIKDEILAGVEAQAFKQLMESALEMTAVTAVSSTEEGIFAGKDDDDQGQKSKQRIHYWTEFRKALDGSNTVFDSANPDNAIKPTHTSGSVYRKHEDVAPEVLSFVATTSSSSPLKLESYTGDPSENVKLFNFLRQKRSDLESITQGKVTFRISETATKQSIVFEAAQSVAKKRLRLDDESNRATAKLVHGWIRDVLPKLEAMLAELLASDEFVEYVNTAGKRAHDTENSPDELSNY